MNHAIAEAAHSMRTERYVARRDKALDRAIAGEQLMLNEFYALQGVLDPCDFEACGPFWLKRRLKPEVREELLKRAKVAQ